MKIYFKNLQAKLNEEIIILKLSFFICFEMITAYKYSLSLV